MIRNWTSSSRMDKVSPKAEAFFTRIMMVADNYGCFYADPRILKSNCYPLKEKMKSDELIPLLRELVDAKIIMIYTVSGKNYLHIYDFGQRLYISTKRQFPEPPGIDNQTPIPYVNNPQQPAAGNGGTRLEGEVELELNLNNGGTAVKPPPPTLDERKKKFYEDLVPFVGQHGKDMVRAFFNYWSEANAGGKKMRWEMERTFEIKRRFDTWKNNEEKFSKGKFQKQNDDTGENRVRASQAHATKI